jgi:hypothetical protein
LEFGVFNMVNFIQLQNDVTLALLASDQLANINVVQYRKLRLQSQVDLSSVYTGVRNGVSGCGILVEMPAFTVDKPNLLGPVGMLEFTLAVIEEPNINMTPATGAGATGGTQLSAEDVAQIIQDELHGLEIAGLVQLWAAPHAIVPIHAYDAACPGTVQYRVHFSMRYNRDQTPRVAMPVPSQAGDTVTLTCATNGATIYYTLDGTTPVPPPTNPGAQIYTAPVQMVSGQTLRARAFLAGMTGSGVSSAVAT